MVDPKRPAGGGSPVDMTSRLGSTPRRRVGRPSYAKLCQLREHGRKHDYESGAHYPPLTEQQVFLRTVTQHILNSTATAPSQTLSADNVLRGAERVLIDIGIQLTDLIGVDGYQALVGRSIHLAAVEFQVLADVRTAESPPGRLVAHGEQQMNPAHAYTLLEASAAIFTHLVRLLEEFLGDELVAGVLRQSLLWPNGTGAC